MFVKLDIRAAYCPKGGGGVAKKGLLYSLTQQTDTCIANPDAVAKQVWAKILCYTACKCAVTDMEALEKTVEDHNGWTAPLLNFTNYFLVWIHNILNMDQYS